jgi:hypothetical protein
MKKLKTCSVEGCRRDFFCRGWCQMHYTRWRRHSDPLAVSNRRGPHATDFPPTPHDQCTFTIKPEEVRKFREFADWLVSLNNHAAARYRQQNARDDAAEHAMAAD